MSDIKRIKLTGLWKKEISGKMLISGPLSNDTEIEIWENGKKTEAKHPDFIMYIAPKYIKKKSTHTGGCDFKKQEYGPAPELDSTEDLPF